MLCLQELQQGFICSRCGHFDNCIGQADLKFLQCFGICPHIGIITVGSSPNAIQRDIDIDTPENLGSAQFTGL